MSVMFRRRMRVCLTPEIVMLQCCGWWWQQSVQNTTTVLRPFVQRYQKKHSPTHTYPDHQPSFISFLHLLWSVAPFLLNLRAWQPFCTTSLQVFFGLPNGLEPSTSYSIHFFTYLQQIPYHCTWFAVLNCYHIFTAWCYASAVSAVVMCPSIRVSVCTSICPSIPCLYCGKTVK